MYDCQLWDECNQFISDVKIHNREQGKDVAYSFLQGQWLCLPSVTEYEDCAWDIFKQLYRKVT